MHDLPTLKDVARAAGVSPSTVSRVLNGSRRAVSAPNVRRVIEAGERLGYVPNFAAQAVAHKLSPICILLTPAPWDPSSWAVVRDAVQLAHDRSLYAVVLPIHGGLIRTFRLARAFMPTEIGMLSSDSASVEDPDLEEEFAEFLDLGGTLLCLTGPGALSRGQP
jgi:LacI family transcriptional regulator